MTTFRTKGRGVNRKVYPIKKYAKKSRETSINITPHNPLKQTLIEIIHVDGIPVFIVQSEIDGKIRYSAEIETDVQSPRIADRLFPVEFSSDKDELIKKVRNNLKTTLKRGW